MRTFEILTLFITAGALTALITHKERRVFLYLLFGAIVVMLMQFFLEGHRWQFAFLVYLLPAMYIAHRFQQKMLNVITKTLFIIWFCFSFIVMWIVPVFTLPTPDGPYNIGTQTFHWVDTSRSEFFTKDTLDNRQIMAQIWYPGDTQPNQDPEPYLDYVEQRATTMASAGGIPEFLPRHLNFIFTNSIKGVPIIKSESRLPILIFSHGITGSRHLHQTLYEYLASRGYVVAAIDHSYDANLTIFPDKSIADYRSEITGHPDSLSIRKMQMETRRTDISFIINQFEKIQSGEISSQLKNQLDLNKIAVGGHSYGGATALTSSALDNRIQACIGLDPWVSPVPQPVLHSGLTIPQLHIMRPSWENSDYPSNYKSLDTILSSSTNQIYRFILEDSEHLDYSDIPLFSPIIHWVMRDVSHLKTDVSIHLLNNIIFEFLNIHLLDKPDMIFKSIMNHPKLKTVS